MYQLLDDLCVLFLFWNYGIKCPTQKIRIRILKHVTNLCMENRHADIQFRWTRRWIRSLKQWSWSRWSGSMVFSSQEGEEITDVLQNATRSLDDMRVSMTEIWMFFFLWMGTDLEVKWIWENLQCDFSLWRHHCECVGDKIILLLNDSSRAAIWMDS